MAPRAAVLATTAVAALLPLLHAQQIDPACFPAMQALQNECCDGGQCPPTTCSTECAPVFLDFMEDMGERCSVVIQTMGLQRLEESCEEAMSCGDDCGHSQQANCGADRAMGLAFSCVNLDPNDFCNSACYAQMEPFVRECADMMPPEMMPMLGVAMTATQTCDASGGDRSCQLPLVAQMCNADNQVSDDADPDELCANPCISTLIPCRDNPIVAAMIDDEDAEGLEALNRICTGMSDGGSIYGDGECNAEQLLPGGQLCAEYETVVAGGQDAMCQDDCTRELMDCLDSPILADKRDDVAALVAPCMRHLENDVETLGDGVCQMMNLEPLCEQLDGLDNLDDVCSTDCITELTDCRRDLEHIPDIDKESLNSLVGLVDGCQSESRECINLFSGFISGLEEVCCPRGGCGNEPPATCSHECAAYFNAFWPDCSEAIGTIMPPDDHQEMDAFAQTCAGEFGRGGRGGGRGHH